MFNNKLFKVGLRGLTSSIILFMIYNLTLNNFYYSHFFEFIVIILISLTAFSMLYDIPDNFGWFPSIKKLCGIATLSFFSFSVLYIFSKINGFAPNLMGGIGVYFPIFFILYVLIEFTQKMTYSEKFWINLNSKNFTGIDWGYLTKAIIIKTFFCAFMIDAYIILLDSLYLSDIKKINNQNIFTWLFYLGLYIDLNIGIVGYLFCSSYFKNTIKSFNPLIIGWIVCFICYPPILNIINLYLRPVDNLFWNTWLTPDSLTYYVWGALLIIFWIIYFWSTICFGHTFSNLTYRKIVDFGPYKYCAHPAYLSKNIYWWLNTVPFVLVSTYSDLFVGIFVMLSWNFIYYLRAKTEEMHLIKYSEYANYLEKVRIKCY